MDNKEKRDFSAKHLDRVLGFFARVEAKASFLFAINTTLLALIALNLRKSDLSLWYVMVPGIAAVLLVVVSLWFIYQCHFPKLEGGSGSLVYFAEISKRTELGFFNECEAVVENEQRLLTEPLDPPRLTSPTDSHATARYCRTPRRCWFEVRDLSSFISTE